MKSEGLKPIVFLNELPADVRTAESLTSFRKGFNTHLFRVHLHSA